jgi:hypothetical protein
MICPFHASKFFYRNPAIHSSTPRIVADESRLHRAFRPLLIRQNYLRIPPQTNFPNVAYILHADDFCKEFDKIPTVNGYLDCDGPDAIDYARMANILDHMRGHIGLPPEDFKSWQDEVFPGQEEKSLLTVPKEVVDNLRDQVFTEENLNLKSIKLNWSWQMDFYSTEPRY